HHVCLCVLSTAVLASLALLTDQNKVYAGLNCKGVANSSGNGSSSDNDKGRIECDGGSNGKGSGGQLSGKRTIDMSGKWGTGGSNRNSDGPAVKVYGRGTNITISSELKITDNGSNSHPAIQVENGGKLTVNNVTMTNMQTGIVVLGPKSSVIVVKGSIGVKNGGGAVIEVGGGGDVTLNRGVKVSGGGDNTGIEVGQGGGTVTLVGTSFTGVQKGIVFKGSKGGASVMGGGATISLENGGTGITMQGSGGASANVMSMTIQGSGGTGAEVKNGTLTVNMVTMTDVKMGMKVTGSGRANVMGGEIKGKGGTGTGVEMSGGTGGMLEVNKVKVEGFATGVKVTSGSLEGLKVMGGMIKGKRVGVEVSGEGILKVNGEATIEVQAGGTGLKVEGNGRASVVGGMIQGSGGVGSVGVDVSTSNTVTLNGGVKVMGFATGLKVTSGELKVMGESTITVETGGTGLMVEGGIASVVGGEIKGKGAGKTGVEMSGTAQVTLNMVKVSGVGRGVYMEKGTLKIERGSITGGGSGYGVYAMGGKVTLDGVTVSKVERGVVMMGKGEMTVTRGEIKEFAKYGVYVGDGVTSASLTGTKIVGGGKGKGIHARGKKVTLSGVEISKVEEGVVMMGTGNLTISGGVIKEFTKYGVYVGIDVTSASLTGTKIVGGGSG
ncbi:right-handed parallel beta-helix repeat-containing protein, partial [Bartonella melophagi]